MEEKKAITACARFLFSHHSVAMFSFSTHPQLTAFGRYLSRPAAFIILAAIMAPVRDGCAQPVLKESIVSTWVDSFNATDNELYKQYVPNEKATEFLTKNIPLFDCPEKNIERTYYFRWWTYRKHIKETPEGFIITEFLPAVPWASKYNAISCALGHHLYEGRWLHDSRYLDGDTEFWFQDLAILHRYSNWVGDAIHARACVTGDWSLAEKMLPKLVENFDRWVSERRNSEGLFHQIDETDGMEVSIGGSGYRATINSYMYGDAKAIAEIAARTGNKEIEARFKAEAAKLKFLVQSLLWQEDAKFFETRKRDKNDGAMGDFVNVREEHGFTPWYFNLPDAPYAVAWKQLMDENGFSAPFGPTTAEQRAPGFTVSYQGHECQWNGPSWPYATSVTLTALANLLNGPAQETISSKDYYSVLLGFARSHAFRELHPSLEVSGKEHVSPETARKEAHPEPSLSLPPWIDEVLNPYTGDWISRTRLKTWKNGTWAADVGGEERGKDYNHSTYCDLVITGLVGLRPRADELLEVNPLIPAEWDYFCLDQVRYHGRMLTIFFDRTGEKYGRGKGFQILVDGEVIAKLSEVGRFTMPLPPIPVKRS